MATVSAPEALAIVQRLRASLTTKALKLLKQKLEQGYRQTKELDSVSRTKAGIACPFLRSDGGCSIYNFRPLDCMTYHSFSRPACEEKLNRPQREIPTSPEIRAIGRGVKAGFGQGIAEANLEQPALRYELIEAIYIGLKDNQAARKYLAGNNIFMPAAIITDSSSGIGYKIKYAPPHLQAEAESVINAEQTRTQMTQKPRYRGKKDS